MNNEHTRRSFLAGVGGTTLVALSANSASAAETDEPVNLATVATPSALYVSGDTRLSALNSGVDPAKSMAEPQEAFGTWPRVDRQWVQYEWSQPVTTDHVDVYWWADGQGIALPASCRLLYWNGSDFSAVKRVEGLGLAGDRFNRTNFEPVRTTRLRLEVTGDGEKSIGILQWKVWSHGPVPAFAPVVDAGADRTVVIGGNTYLAGAASWLAKNPGDGVRWTMVSGPGNVSFADAAASGTTARVSEPGDYVLQLTARGRGKAANARLHLKAESPPPAERLDVVYTTRYAITSPLWSARAKALIVNWIPHCIAYCERTDLPDGAGGLDNFVEAAKAIAGNPHGKHKGYVFSNAWVHQTVESMCIALMVDPQGDEEILAAHEKMRAALERWIPIILAAQEPDGYLQTAYTRADRRQWPERWSPDHRGNHEGYVAGYFIESAINHYTFTDGKDLRLYKAAKKLADCWVANIGPGKKAWFDGHQEMEQALVRFGRFVNDMEGSGQGDRYVALARFLLESRRGGAEYDQSHAPPERQYEAVGHAVRAVYFYSGMADVAAETHNRDYQSAVKSLWDNMVNRKYYVTGGVGSGETAEGFGPNYSLRDHAYCESCSSCGLVFFQYKLNLAYHDARYADLYEETLYNALLGATDLEGRNYCYTNPLINTERAAWHTCPCCVGNIPRTLLMVPTWAYLKKRDAVFVNLFIGSRISVGDVAGTRVEMVQETNYPWQGAVAITVNPEAAREFAVHVRVPDRNTSALYSATPAIKGIERLRVNGKAVAAQIENGYAVLRRRWQAGDRIEFELPLAPQRVVADQKIEATRGKVALRYGPVVYNIEVADQPRIDQALSAAPIAATWRSDLLGGVMTLTGKWADGTSMVAVPNFARMNRAGLAAPEFPRDQFEGRLLSRVWVAAPHTG